MHTLTFFIHFIQSHAPWAWLLLFIGILIEGEVTLIIAGILGFQHALSLPEIIFVAALGAVAKTFLGYAIGSWLSKKWPQSKFLKYIERRILTLLPKFRERPFWSIFISKFVYGANNVTLIFSGYMKTALNIFLRAEFISTIIWLVGFLGMGYFFSYAALTISHDIRKVVLIMFIFILVFILIQRLLSFLFDVSEIEE